MSELQTLAASDSGWPGWATPWSPGRFQIQSAPAAFLAAGPGELVSCDGGLRQQCHSDTFLDGRTVHLDRQP